MSEYSAVKTPNKSDFSVSEVCSSVKKALFQNGDKGERSYVGSSMGSYAGGEFMMQAKIEHLEKERIELTMQLHKRDEKDRDRKLKLEQIEFRLKSSEEERTKAVLECSENREQVVRLKFEADELRAEIVRLNQEIQNTNRVEAMDMWKKMTSASRALKKTEEDLALSNQQKLDLSKENERLSAELTEANEQRSKLTAEINAAREQIATLLEENQEIPELQAEKKMLIFGMETERAQHQEVIANLQHENEELHQQIATLTSDLSFAQEQSKNAVTIVSSDDSMEDVLQLKKQLFESETKRRKLHNQLQDLKGNIRVFLRCRPFLQSDGEDAYQTKQTNLLLHDDKSNVTVLNPMTVGAPGGGKASHQFTFDHIFASDANQQEVYKEVSDLVQSVLDGYRVCVFSYGQTGSGKVIH